MSEELKELEEEIAEEQIDLDAINNMQIESDSLLDQIILIGISVLFGIFTMGVIAFVSQW